MKTLMTFLIVLTNFNLHAQNRAEDWLRASGYRAPITPADNTRVVLPILRVNEIVQSSVRPPQQQCTSCIDQEERPLPGITDSFLKDNAPCELFIDKEGNYGKYGNEVLSALRALPADKSLTRDGLETMTSPSNACPKWATLSEREREHFWVWTFAAIAFSEARCKETARNAAGTNTVAIGLLQLEEPKSKRSWRGGNCTVASVKDYKNNIKCGMTIMSSLMNGKYGTQKRMTHLYLDDARGGSYWQHLKLKKGGPIGAKMREFPLCN